MDIRVDGGRSTNESWLEAHRIPARELPPITEDEQRVADKLTISTEEYRQSKYAAEITKRQLEKRSFRVGQLVEKWLHNHEPSAGVRAVRLKTFDGKFRVDVQSGDTIQSVFIAEDLADDILDSGSKEAQQSLERLLSAIFQR